MAEFLIIGAGIAGLTTAHALRHLGHTVRIVEGAPELREVGAGVVLGANAMRALHALGLHDKVQAQGSPITRLDLRAQDGQLLQSADTSDFTRAVGHDNLGIHRAALQQILRAGLPPECITLGVRFERFEETLAGIIAHFADGSMRTADALIGADGIRSAVRRQLLPRATPRYAGYTCWRAVVDATHLGLPVGESAEVWGERGRRFGYVPVGGGRVYWFACLNSPEPQHPRFKGMRATELRQEFQDFCAPVPELLALTQDQDLLWNDILDVKPLPHLAYNRVLLLGDAGHATTPNLGQGAGMAVEDAAVLGQCLQQTSDIVAAFQQFEKRRLKRTSRIITTSWQLGKVGQLENPLLTKARNYIMRSLPAAVSRSQMAWLYDAL